MVDKRHIDAIDYDKSLQQYFNLGTVEACGVTPPTPYVAKPRTMYVDTPYHQLCVHVLFKAFPKAPTIGTIQVWNLIRDEGMVYHKVDVVEVSALKLVEGVEGFTAGPFYNGSEGFLILNNTDVPLLETTVRLSAVPINARKVY